MVSERFSQIERLYHAARELHAEERSAFLQQACGGDNSVRQEVEALLAQDREDDPFLETPALHAAAKALAEEHASTQPGLNDSPLVGKTVSHYRILGELGRGGMGVVYKAEDTRLGRPVALKFLRDGSGPSLGSPPGSPESHALDRFQREARAASVLNHPNICTVYDVGRFEGSPFIVMEYLEGRTLRQCIEEGPLSVSAVVDLALQIADGLSAAHTKGIVHRDIKPTNILVTTKGQAKILDFGLAKPESSSTGGSSSSADTRVTQTSLTNPGMAVGTVAYMSPEQARGDDVDARSDLFSFGAVLYEISSGHHPFPGDSAAAILHHIVADQPTPLREWTPSAPVEFERIVTKALEKDRDLRFQSAAELGADLKRFKRSSSADGSPVAEFAGARFRMRLSARLRRHWRAAGVLALAAAAVAAGWFLLLPPPLPRITEYKQLTNDAAMKTLVATDGVRLYLNESFGASGHAAQMTIDGGEPAPLALPSPLFTLFDVSPDGGNLLAAEISTYTQGPLWIIPAVGGSAHRVGNLEASSGAWSPDGRWLAFTRKDTLFVATKDGSDVRPLWQASTMVRLPAWSPDGRRIRFTVSDDVRHSQTLWEVSTRGMDAHAMFPTRGPSNICCGRWTPDGRYFVFAREGQIWASREPRWSLFHTAPRAAQLTSGAIQFDGPLPSRDRKRVFAGGLTLRGEAVRYDRQKAAFVPLLPSVSADFLTFSRDGQWIAYVTFPQGALWRSRADRSERVQLTEPSNISVALLPRWSPDGTKVLYSFLSSGELPKAYVVPFEGGRPAELTVPGGGISDPNWSPDGRKICYSGDHAAKNGGPNIHILDLQSHQVTDVAGSEEFFSPRWSPDGRHLAALSLDSSRMVVFDFGSGKWRQLTRQGNFAFPNWSHDSRAIYYIQESINPAVMLIRLDSGATERMVDLRDIRLAGFYNASLSLTPDDDPVLVRDVGGQEIYALEWGAR